MGGATTADGVEYARFFSIVGSVTWPQFMHRVVFTHIPCVSARSQLKSPHHQTLASWTDHAQPPWSQPFIQKAYPVAAGAIDRKAVLLKGVRHSDCRGKNGG